MNYEKAYKEALNRAKLLKDNPDKVVIESHKNIHASEYIFPELKESEEEKIKKELINWFKSFSEKNWRGHDKEDIVAWLEKNGGQASSQTNERAWLYLVSDVLTWKDGIGQYLDDPRVQELAKKLCSEYAQKLYNSAQDVAFGYIQPKTEPKFKVGDWIIQENIGVYKVIEVCESWYEVIDDEDNHYSISFDKEGMCHLWTIEGAKDGDIIYAESKFETFDFISIFFGLENENFCGYCDISSDSADYNDDLDHWEFDNNKGFIELDRYNFYPASKEQRDLLFAKMKEAGYEWDAEKKEAIRIY